MAIEAHADLSELRSRVAGPVLEPGDERWGEARAAWNLVADQHPAAVAYVETADDVRAAIAFAGARGLRVAPQGTGHGAAAWGDLDGTILIKTERMRGIAIDAAARVGRFEAGVIWLDAADAAAEHGLATLAGSAPDVGVVGYTTGGGLGSLARRYGLACNSVRAIEVVTADGELRRADAEHDPDLFWALRGGGGIGGVVTAMEFDLIPLPEVFAGSVLYPADERSAEILHRYREWTATVPDEVTSGTRFLRLPPLPVVPEPLRDRPLLMLTACYAGPEADGAALIAPLRALGEPVMDLFGAMPPSRVFPIYMEPEEPVPGLVHTATLRELPEAAVDAFVEVAGPDSGSPLLIAELRHAGGALAKPTEGAGAASHIDGEFVLAGIGLPMTPEAGAAIARHIDAVLEAMKPWSTGQCYFNFADRPVDAEALFDPATLARLREVNRRYDPDGLIVGRQDIEA